MSMGNLQISGEFEGFQLQFPKFLDSTNLFIKVAWRNKDLRSQIVKK